MNDQDFLLLVGKNISRLRKEKGLSQSQLGEIVGIERNNISNIENGRSNLTLVTLRKFSRAFDCHEYELLKVVKSEN